MSNLEKKSTAILLAGGNGTRLRSLTHDLIPKPLTTINGKPLIQHTMDLMSPKLVESLIFALGHHAQLIIHWVNSNEFPYKVMFADPQPGILEAVSNATHLTDSLEYIVCNTDEVRYGLDIEKLLWFHRHSGKLASTVLTSTNHLYRFNPLILDDRTSLVSIDPTPHEYYRDHPEVRGLINVGIFIFDPKVVSYFDRSIDPVGWKGMVKPLIDLKQVSAYIDNKIRFANINTPEDINNA